MSIGVEEKCLGLCQDVWQDKVPVEEIKLHDMTQQRSGKTDPRMPRTLWTDRGPVMNKPVPFIVSYEDALDPTARRMAACVS